MKFHGRMKPRGREYDEKKAEREANACTAGDNVLKPRRGWHWQLADTSSTTKYVYDYKCNFYYYCWGGGS